MPYTIGRQAAHGKAFALTRGARNDLKRIEHQSSGLRSRMTGRHHVAVDSASRRKQARGRNPAASSLICREHIRESCGELVPRGHAYLFRDLPDGRG